MNTEWKLGIVNYSCMLKNKYTFKFTYHTFLNTFKKSICPLSTSIQHPGDLCVCRVLVCSFSTLNRVNVANRKKKTYSRLNYDRIYR